MNVTSRRSSTSVRGLRERGLDPGLQHVDGREIDLARRRDDDGVAGTAARDRELVHGAIFSRPPGV